MWAHAPKCLTRLLRLTIARRPPADRAPVYADLAGYSSAVDCDDQDTAIDAPGPRFVCADGDACGEPGAQSQEACLGAPGTTATADDCNDTDSYTTASDLVPPGPAEDCHPAGDCTMRVLRGGASHTTEGTTCAASRAAGLPERAEVHIGSRRARDPGESWLWKGWRLCWWSEARDAPPIPGPGPPRVQTR